MPITTVNRPALLHPTAQCRHSCTYRLGLGAEFADDLAL
jgi:hypothetical protein